VTSTVVAEPAAAADRPPADPPEPAVRVPEIIRRRLAPLDRRFDGYSWLAAGIVALIAAILRLVGLAHPRGKMFDELYYATEAKSMLAHGVEWDDSNNTAKYVVHPPLGKWCIALGEWATKWTHDAEFGWRISAAVAGIITVLLITRIARRMFGSTVLGCAAGLLMTVDGMHFVLSRTALLDIFLLLFLLAAFGCLVLDRDARRARWMRHLESGADPARPGRASRPPFSWRHGVPWWRLATGLLLGAAFAVKWSAIFYLPVFVGLIVAWEVGLRRSAGVRRPWRDTFLDETGWLVVSVALVPIVYLSSWAGWFATDDGWDRHWLQSQGKPERPVIGALLNLWHYHQESLGFHSQLASSHPYQSWPWQWLLLGRPVAFYWSSAGPCGSNSCASEVLLVGTPVLWWSFLVAIPLLVWFGIARRDWRMPAILLGAAAGIVPWFYWASHDRTMFYFYALPAEPFLILAVVYVLGALMRSSPNAPESSLVDRRIVGAVVAGAYLAAVGLCFAYFYPVYTGQILTYAEWSARMWLGGRWI